MKQKQQQAQSPRRSKRSKRSHKTPPRATRGVVSTTPDVEQDRLFHALQDPLTPIPADPMAYSPLVRTLTKQRDDALNQLNDWANIEITITRLREARQVVLDTATALIRTGQQLQRELAGAKRGRA